VPDIPQQAEYWGIDGDELTVLTVIARWFNGQTFLIRGEERQISTHHELLLEDMFTMYIVNYDSFREAHQRLLEKDLVEEKYVARRKIDWAPTEDGRQAIRDCIGSWDDDIAPRWADESEGRVLCGDPKEGLRHRKGVEIAGTTLPNMDWARQSNDRPYGVEWYPTDRHGESCHDLYVDTMDGIDDIGVEVITSSNNLDYLVSTWKRHQSKDRLTFWVFDCRETACRLWNELSYRDEFHTDEKFTTPSNWSVHAINRMIWRSSQQFHDRPAGEVIHTVTGLLNGNASTIQNLLEDYYTTT
jgi:hypothetical protein